jgi:hypothetical protein
MSGNPMMRIILGLLGIAFLVLSVRYFLLGLQIDLLSPPNSAGEPLRLARADMYVHVALAYFGAGVALLAHTRR